jgi:hypothetical protein
MRLQGMRYSTLCCSMLMLQSSAPQAADPGGSVGFTPVMSAQSPSTSSSLTSSKYCSYAAMTRSACASRG